MSPIKFRAWDGDRTVKVLTIGWTEGEIDWINTSKNGGPVEDFIIMQFTGYLDKNGVEIYENDLVADEYGRTYQVVFKGDCWRCEPIKKGYAKNRWISTDLEIVGNVCEDEELLEETE